MVDKGEGVTTVRRSNSKARVIGNKVAREIEELIKSGFTGSFNLKGQMRSGGIGLADWSVDPGKKDLLKGGQTDKLA